MKLKHLIFILLAFLLSVSADASNIFNVKICNFTTINLSLKTTKHLGQGQASHEKHSNIPSLECILVKGVQAKDEIFVGAEKLNFPGGDPYYEFSVYPSGIYRIVN